MIPSWLPLAVWFLPLAVAVLVAFVPKQAAGLAHGLAAAVMAAATGLAGWMVSLSLGAAEPFAGPHATWLDVGGFTLGVGVYVDHMGAIMAAVVCLLATLVLLFNRWYMHHDALAARFPWQFCGFVFAMLGVVLSDNLFLSFCCWELVGLGSYLLIGFWFDKPVASEDPDYQHKKGKDARGVLENVLSPSYAQLKAFVTNRVGDAGFLLGIGAFLALAVAAGHGTDALSWQTLQTVVHDGAVAKTTFLGMSGHTLLVLAAVGVFCGAIGKSAQFPLHVWLPEAMQGPTTASSIIHAATMVAAGVFLVARSYPLFPDEALMVVGWTGGITCLLAASIACVQWDLKAVLAYSTISQLGLMFVGLGAGEDAGGRIDGISHLFTHANFKCLLFLCAGAVIHACEGNQDLHRMGGLRKHMPVTAFASLAAVLAIIGAPLFAGYFSKDLVLGAAYYAASHHGGLWWGPFVLACLGSLLTAAYMLRWWLRLFAGEPRDHHVGHHAHDPSGLAKVALIALVPGTLCFPWGTHLGDWLMNALAGPAAHGEGEHAAGGLHALHEVHPTALAVALTLFALGGAFAFAVYGRASAAGIADGLAKKFAWLYRNAGELWHIDRAWYRLFARGVGDRGATMAARVDLGSVQRLEALEAGTPTVDSAESLDGLIDGIGHTLARAGTAGANWHGGRLPVYLASAVLLAMGLCWWGLSR